MNRIANGLMSSPCTWPYDAPMAEVLMSIERIRFHKWADLNDPALVCRIRAVVIHYLVIPVAVIGSAVGGVLFIGPSIFAGFLRAQLVHALAITIFTFTLPVRLLGYYAGKKELLFPIDYKQKARYEHPLVHLARCYPREYVKEKLRLNPLSDREQREQMSSEERLQYFVLTQPEGSSLMGEPSFWNLEDLLGRLRNPSLLYGFLGRNPDVVADNRRLLARVAIRTRSRELVNQMLRQGMDINADKGTLLSETIRLATHQARHLDFARFLMREKGAAVDGAVLEKAKDSLPCLQLLAEHGADFNICLKGVAGERTLLAHAIEMNRPDIVRLLVDHRADLRLRGRGTWGDTPLFYAIEKDRPEIVRVLIEKGVDLRSPQYEGCGATPLFYAIEKDRLAIVRLLIEKGVDLHSLRYGTYGGTPLEWARSLGKREIVNLLSPYYPEPPPRPKEPPRSSGGGFWGGFPGFNWSGGFGSRPEPGFNSRGPDPFIPRPVVRTAAEKLCAAFPDDLCTRLGIQATDALQQVQQGVREKNLWAIFRLSKGEATRRGVNTAYRTMSLKLHPDKNKGSNEAFFQQIFRALTDVRDQLLQECWA